MELSRSQRDERLTAVELDAWRGMLRIAVWLRRELGQDLLTAHDLSMADYDFLVRLAEQPDRGMRMAELADAILQPPSSLTRIARGLEERGLIVRESAESDGRGTVARLTDAGESIFRQAQRTHLNGVRERFLAHLTDAQLDGLAEAWRAVDPRALAGGPDEPRKSKA